MIRAVLLALGEFGVQLTSDAELADQVAEYFLKHPDPGVHAAARWALQAAGHSERVQEMEANLSNASRLPDQRWYVSPLRQTFMILDGTEPFEMGSPPTEAGREADHEELHSKLIGRHLAVSMTEVTNLQFRACLGDHEYWDQLRSSKSWRGLIGFTPYADDQNPYGSMDLSDDAPVVAVNPSLAALFCNWLSRLDGIPKEHWCYTLSETGQIVSRESFLSLSGYRLPTETEWEFAARSGIGTARHFGSDDQLLDQYAWYAENGWTGRKATGQLKPNEWGLFDVYGNVCELCSHWEDSLSHLDTFASHVAYEPTSLSEGTTPFRGGAHRDIPRWMRSAYRSSNHSYTVWETGFRPVRTIRDDESEYVVPDLTLAIPSDGDALPLDDYVGTYRIDALWTLVVTRENNQLFAQELDYPSVRLTPMAADRFYAKTVWGDIEFKRDSQMKVSGIFQWHWHFPDVKELPRIE